MQLLLPLATGATLAALALPTESVRQDDEQARLEALARGIEADIAELRGKPFRHEVKVEALDKPGLVAYVKKKMAEEREVQQRSELASKLLGMLAPEDDLEAITLTLLEEQVGGLYDPPTDTFYVMEGLGEDMARVVMAHELVHALDDQYHGLDILDQARLTNSDARLAVHAVAEGSAMVTMTEWMMANLESLDMKAVMEAQASMETEALQKTPDVLWKPLLAAYIRGQAFLTKRDGQAAAIERAFVEPPRSTEQILHPEKYWEEVDEPVVFDLVAGDGLPAGAKIVHTDTLGELTLAILTTPLSKRGAPKSDFAMLGVRYTNDAATGWGGDRYALLEVGDGHAVHLATRWDTEDDAVEFLEAVEVVRPAIRAGLGEVGAVHLERIGDAVVLTVGRGIDQETTERIAEGIDQEPSETASEDGTSGSGTDGSGDGSGD